MAEYVAPPADHPPEEWRPIKGYEGRYDISSHGRVRTYRKRVGSRVDTLSEPIFRVPTLGGAKGQYRKVVICEHGVAVELYIHRLVALHFIGPCPPKHEAAHDNGIGHHNWVDNLAGKTRKANHLDKRRHGTSRCGENSTHHVLTEPEVLEIIELVKTVPGLQIARRYGVNHKTIYAIRDVRTWAHLPREKAA